MSSTVIQLALCIAGIVLPIIALRRGLFRFPSADAPAPSLRSVSAASEIGAPYFFGAILIIYFTQVVSGGLVITALFALQAANSNSNAAPASPSLQQLTFGQQAILAASTYTLAIIAAFFALKVLRKQAATPRHPLLDVSISPAQRADNAGLSLLRGPAPVHSAAAPPRPSRPIRSTLVQSTIAFAIIFPVCILVSTLTTYLASLIDGIPPDPIAHDTLRLLLDHLAPAPGSPAPPLSTTDVLAIAAIILGAAIGAPILEEFIFRVFAQSALLTFTRRRWLSIFLTSVFFLLLHIGSATFADNPSKVENPSGVAWYALPSLFILSLGLGLAYERTGRIAVPILIHAAFNVVNLAVAIFVLPEPAI